MCRTIAATLGLLASALVLSGAIPATFPSTAPTTTRIQGGDLADIIRRLASESYKDREAAQRELDKITARQIDSLRQWAATTMDEEAKARLLQRIQTLQMQIKSDPPNLTLTLRNASLVTMTEALSKAAGISIELSPRGIDPDNYQYSIAVRDQPFWEVMAALSRQHGLQLRSFSGKFAITPADATLNNLVRIGPFAVLPSSIIKSQVVNLQNEAGRQVQPQQVTLGCTLAIDPRMTVAAYLDPVFTEILDDAGNVLYRQAPAEPSRDNWKCYGPSYFWSCSARLSLPDHPGKSITSAKGVGRFILETASERLEITGLESKLNQPIHIDGRELIFTAYSDKNDRITLSASVREEPGVEPVGPGPAQATLTFVDATGQTIGTTRIFASTFGASVAGRFTLPLKVVISVPTATRQVLVPFELKNLPLPQ